MKQGLATLLKAVAGIAALVCVMTPVSGIGIVVFVIALFVAIIAGVTGSHLSDAGAHQSGPDDSELGCHAHVSSTWLTAGRA